MKNSGIFLLGLALLLVIAGPDLEIFSQTPDRTQDKESNVTKPPVTNFTSAIQVISLRPMEAVTPAGQAVEIVLKNVSGKSIDGYSIGYSRGSSITGDLTSTARNIAPGDEFKLDLIPSTDIVIRQVIFEDGTIDGDATAAQELLDRRTGMREQLERIYVFLNAAPPPADVEELKTKLRALPVETTPDRSYWVKLGLRHIRDEVLQDVLRFDQEDFHSELGKLAERLNKQLVRLTRKTAP